MPYSLPGATCLQTPTTLELVDVAGLVQGASKGEGLGNQFLGNIRTTDAIVQVCCLCWLTKAHQDHGCERAGVLLVAWQRVY